MNSTETAKLKVEIEGDEADKTLLSLQAEAKEINKALRDMKAAGEVGSDAWLDLKNRQKEVNSELKELTKNIDLNDASMSELNAHSRLLNKELRDLKIGSDEWIAKMKEVQDVDSRIESVRKEVRGLKDDADEQTGVWSSFKSAFMGAFTFEAVTEAAEAIWDFGKDVLETTAKFEKYNAILETTLGSSEAGAKAFQMLQEFAAKTNFGVDELTDSYIKLANRGLRPGQDEMMKMADVANATGKPMKDLVEAINDVNNTDRWNEFGIKAQTNGDKVSLTFKGVTKEVERSEAGVLSAITAFGEMNGVMGMTEKISNTLEGQMSNLEDNFDRLKTTVGNDASGSFKDLIAVGNELIDAFIDIWKGTAPVREGFADVVEVGGRFGETVGTLIRVLFGLDEKTKATSIVADTITFAFRVVATTLMASVGAIQIVADGFNALLNKGKEVANFFGAGFKIDPKANFDTLAKNFEANAKAIDKLWEDSETTRQESTKKSNAAIVADAQKSGQTMTAEAKKEAAKKAEAVEKAEQDSLKKIADMQVRAIADEAARKIAEINLQYDREEAAVRKSVASATTKDKQLALLAQEREAKITKAEEDARAKKEKETTELETKLDALKAKLLNDDSARKIAELKAQAQRDTDYVNKYIKDDERKAETLKLINDKLTSDIEAVNDKHRADELAKNEKKRQTDAAATKQMFDNEYKEFVALSDAKLINAKDNADAIYRAKLEKLEGEYQYNRRKLQMEADEERAKNNALVQDADQRANSEKAIDDRLKAQLSAADSKYEQDKTRLTQEHLEQRKRNTQDFFSAIDSLMDGDFTKFNELLMKKLKNDEAANDKKLQNFNENAQAIFDIADQSITALQKLNQQYLESQLKKLETEKQAELDKAKELYEKGLISKEEYEGKVGEINAKYAEMEKEEKLKAWRRNQAMQITQAIIGGAAAAVASLASMGWPLGLIGVAAAAVEVALHIKTIKNQQPPDFARGGSGKVKNAGVVRGSRHGSTYGEAGISMIDRLTGQEVGEMEGDEPFMILSRNTYRNNKDVVDLLLDSSLHRNGAPIYGEGGTYSDYLTRRGNERRKPYKNGGIGGRRMFLDGGYVEELDGVNRDFASASANQSETYAQIQKSQALMDDIAKNTETTVDTLKDIEAFLAGQFLDSIKSQNEAFASDIKGQTGQLVNGQGTANALLERIAAKDLSVSVTSVVNVWNQINVVIDKSNL